MRRPAVCDSTKECVLELLRLTTVLVVTWTFFRRSTVVPRCSTARVDWLCLEKLLPVFEEKEALRSTPDGCRPVSACLLAPTCPPPACPPLAMCPPPPARPPPSACPPPPACTPPPECP